MVAMIKVNDHLIHVDVGLLNHMTMDCKNLNINQPKSTKYRPMTY